jgi:hypothetical protein
MKQRHPKMMSLVVGTAGLHEMESRWVVAAFEDGMQAIDWCEKCNEYGKWIAEMEEMAFRDPEKPDYENDKRPQWQWAVEGSFAQQDADEAEFEKEYPTGDWDYFHRREAALMLNPYDDQAYENRSHYIRYAVVRVVFNPEGPYYP